MSARTRLPVESARLSVADVRHEHATIALIAIGSALAIIAAANILGFIVGRFF